MRGEFDSRASRRELEPVRVRVDEFFEVRAERERDALRCVSDRLHLVSSLKPRTRPRNRLRAFTNQTRRYVYRIRCSAEPPSAITLGEHVANTSRSLLSLRENNHSIQTHFVPSETTHCDRNDRSLSSSCDPLGTPSFASSSLPPPFFSLSRLTKPCSGWSGSLNPCARREETSSVEGQDGGQTRGENVT